jgi:hypothetical protein
MRIIPRLEQHPALVGWVQTPPGKIACVAVFSGFLWVLRAPLVPLWREITIVVGLLTLFPSRRRVLLTLTGIYWLAAHAVRHGSSRVIDLVARSEGLGCAQCAFCPDCEPLSSDAKCNTPAD